MALPIWAIYMKKCLADEELNVSDEDFKRPSKLSIETDCSKWKENTEDTEEVPDEFDF